MRGGTLAAIVLAAALLAAGSARAPAGASSAAASVANSPGAAAAPGSVSGPLPFERLQALAAAADVFKEVAISPDGHRAAWTEAVAGADGLPGERTAIYEGSLGAPGAGPRRITARAATAGAAWERDPAWSPRGDRLAFLSDSGARSAGLTPRPQGTRVPAETPASADQLQLQLWIVELGSGKTTEITHLDGYLRTPRFSPDGQAIAFLFTAGNVAEPGPTRPTERDSGVVGETPREQRLAVVELATGALAMVSPADLHVYEYDWSPDGRGFAATAAHGSGDDNWWTAELVAIPRSAAPAPVERSVRADGQPAATTPQPGGTRTLLAPAFQIANPSFSPDGQTIAFIGGLMSDEGVTGGDLYVFPAAGGEARNLTPELSASVSWLAWSGPAEILAAAIEDGGSALLTVEPGDGKGGQAGQGVRSGRVTEIWKAPELLWGGRLPRLALARDGRTLAGVRQSFATPPEVSVGVPGRWSPLSRRHAALRSAWGEARSLHWQSDGAAVQGWLLAPPRIEAGRRYPMIVVVHGGPASAHKAGWPGIAGALANRGFFVLLPNPRGSYGAGEAFTRGNVKDFGYGDLRDILGGVEAAVAAAPIDGGRVGLYGWSYGGYMAMWAVTQTDRFRAAVAGAGVANWQSYYGQNRIDRWMIPYFGASVYDDPWIYARSSPINFIKNVKTPTLVLQGERDAEVPAAQSYEFWHALRTLGVETQLVIYPGQGHHLEPAADRDRLARIVDWFEAHLR